MFSYLQNLDRRSRTASPSSSSCSPSRGLPSFRFSTAEEELTEIHDYSQQEDNLKNSKIVLKGTIALSSVFSALIFYFGTVLLLIRLSAVFRHLSLYYVYIVELFFLQKRSFSLMGLSAFFALF